jgi:hypothetical protein
MTATNNPRARQGLGPFNVLTSATTGTGVVDFGAVTGTVSWQIVPNGTITAGQVTMELSLDNITWIPTPLAAIANVSAAVLANPYVLATGANALFVTQFSDIPVRYARARISTTVTGGTVSVVMAGI